MNLERVIRRSVVFPRAAAMKPAQVVYCPSLSGVNAPQQAPGQPGTTVAGAGAFFTRDLF